MRKNLNSFSRTHCNNDKTNKDEYDKICPKGSRPGIPYGNPEIHKPVVDNLPIFRPILSAINTFGYNLVRFLIPVLAPLTLSEFTIKDSFSFAKEITYDSSLYMASLDVESLFTNIPLNETIKNCLSDLHIKKIYNGKLSKRDLFKLQETATSESSFIFDYLFYKQVAGVAIVLLWVPPLQMHFYAIMKKNGWIIVQSTLNL